MGMRTKIPNKRRMMIWLPRAVSITLQVEARGHALKFGAIVTPMLPLIAQLVTIATNWRNEQVEPVQERD